MVELMRQRWQVITAALTGIAFLLGALLPVATGIFVTHLPGFGTFAGELQAFAWGLSGPAYQDAVPWFGLDVPTLLHAFAFTAWWVTLVIVAGAMVTGIPTDTRRILLLAAAGCATAAPVLHVIGLTMWLGAVTPGLGLVFQGATAMGLVLLAWRVPPMTAAPGAATTA